MLIEFIHLAADFFMVFWSVTVLFIFILLGIKCVFVDRKFDEERSSEDSDVSDHNLGGNE